ncbi:MAG: hypothetical protein ACRD3I_11525 [Terriglobales bacterium]
MTVSAGDRLALMEQLGAAVPGDPLRFLRQKVVEDELTIAELARELAWEEEKVRQLLDANRRHLQMADRTRRLGRSLTVWYRGGAISILTNILAIIMGFGIASAWQARQDELRDLRGQLGVLNPLAQEVAFNAARAAELSDQPAQCKFDGFNNATWARLTATAEFALLDPRLYKHLEETYQDLDVATGPTKLRGSACVQQLQRLRQGFGKLKDDMAASIIAVRTKMFERATEPATAGLVNFVGRMLVVTIGLLLLPGAVYWVMLASNRFVR